MHRPFLEKLLGRRIGKDEVVRHIDGDPTNNSLDNLRIMKASDNAQPFREERKNKWQTKV